MNSRIFEVNSKDWLQDFIAKSSQFVEIWKKKGNTKFKIDINKGKIQNSKKNIPVNFRLLSQIFAKNKMYAAAYPLTTKYIKGEYRSIQPEKIDNTDWDNVNIEIYVYTPNINYNGEHYPVAVVLRPVKKLEVIEDFLHIHSFESSSFIANESIVNSIFEEFVDSVKGSFKGITISAKVPTAYTKYTYHGHRFEDCDVENVLKLEF